MRAFEEIVTDAIKIIYKNIVPLEALVCSYTNTIITNTNTTKGLSFVECYVQDGNLKFLMINIFISHEKEVISRSNVSTFEI